LDEEGSALNLAPSGIGTHSTRRTTRARRQPDAPGSWVRTALAQTVNLF
jgi:hypothetical protein